MDITVYSDKILNVWILNINTRCHRLCATDIKLGHEGQPVCQVTQSDIRLWVYLTLIHPHHTKGKYSR